MSEPMTDEPNLDDQPQFRVSDKPVCPTMWGIGKLTGDVETALEVLGDRQGVRALP